MGKSADAKDSPELFQADLAAVIVRSGVSLRGLESRSGWSKSAIWKAQRGPRMPNLGLVEAVVEVCGAKDAELAQWRTRFERLTAQPINATNAVPKRRRTRMALTIAVATSMLTGGGVAATRYWWERPSANVIGGVNIARECREEYPSQPNVWTYPTDQSSPYTWACTSNGTLIAGSHGIDMNRACSRQYGESVYAVVVRPKDAYSWRCARK